MIDRIVIDNFKSLRRVDLALGRMNRPEDYRVAGGGQPTIIRGCPFMAIDVDALGRVLVERLCAEVRLTSARPGGGTCR